ncbi:MAG: signal peptidase II [Thermoleophilia bacterium]
MSRDRTTRLSHTQVMAAAERRERRERRSRWTTMAILAVLVFAADQALKITIRAVYAEGEGTDLTGWLRIARVTNEGIAFGLFPGRQGVVATITVLALCGIAVAIAGLVRRNPWAAAGAGFLVGGSLGNLLDRVFHSGVTDYVDFSRWPAFNLADVAIGIGAVLIVMGLLEASEEDAEDPAT